MNKRSGVQSPHTPKTDWCLGLIIKSFLSRVNVIDWSSLKKKNLTKEMKYVSIRLRLVRVKAFPENISFSENAIFRKGKCIQVFGCVGIRFAENQFRCLVRTNILQKMTSILRKINSHVCFSQTFCIKWNSFFTENQFSCLVCGSFYEK